MKRWPVLLALLALASGCIGQNPEPNPGSSSSSQTSSSAGTLVVEVTDPSLSPLSGATVEVSGGDWNRTLETNDEGIAAAEELPAGSAVLTARAPDHQDKEQPIQVPPGDNLTVSVALEPVPEEPLVQVFEFNGFFECSATYLIVTGDCFATPRAVLDEAGAPVSLNATNHRYVFPFPVQKGWETIRVQQTWEEGELTAGSTMRVNLEPATAGDTEGHSPHYARAQGASPVELTLHANQTHPSSSDPSLTLPSQAAELRTRSFHLGIEETQDAAGTGLLGVGFAIQQSFTVVIEVTYR